MAMNFLAPGKGARWVVVAAGVSALLWKLSPWSGGAVHAAPPAAVKPALTVTTATLQTAQWSRNLTANGSVVAWQEASIGAEITAVRIVGVYANIGDHVVKGQLLADLQADTAQANVAEAQALLQENEALLAEASNHAQRMRKLREVGFVSAQQVEQALNNEKAARARLDVQRARQQTSALRLSQMQIRAPDAGVISSRSATVGTLTQPGMELFRLIRQGRLEWHAELTAEELISIRSGMEVELNIAPGRSVHGRVRAVAPAINPQTRYGQVLVDLPANSGLVAGMFARGTFRIGEQAESLPVLPQSAVMSRDGGAYVLAVDGQSRVHERKVVTGRRQGEQIEIVSGLAQGVPVVKTGGAFLVEGDAVRVIGPGK